MLYTYSQYGLAGLALILLVSAVFVRGKRGPLIWAFASAACAALGARYEAFWALAVFTMMIPWALIMLGEWIDTSWRFRTGLVFFVGVACALCIYPTYMDERWDRPDSRLVAGLDPDARATEEAAAKSGDRGFGRFVRTNIPFRLVRGLDLKGGLRLVYTVDVEEAIKDKRDRFFDEIRASLARSYGIVAADAQPKVADLEKLREKLKVEKSKTEADRFTVTFDNPDDSAKINDEFLKRYLSEMSVLRSADRKSVEFRIHSDVESNIRDTAVAQAKDTVLRRIDGLGLKEAQVSSRDEDIIIEVPGSDEAQFKEIREIISQTARLEFKMVADEVDFLAQVAKGEKPESLPKGLRFDLENAPLGPGKTKPVTVATFIKKEGQDMKGALDELRKWADEVAERYGMPDTYQLGFGKHYEYDEDKEILEEVGWRTYYLFSKAEITGDMIRDAQARPDQSEGAFGRWVVSMEFTTLGGDRFEQVTGENIKRRFAIILDDKVESAPVIQGKIAGGHGQITMGSGTPEQQLKDSKKLELVLRSGALPAPISLSNEQVIGPSLGTDAIEQGLKGAAVGGGLVLLIMLLMYSRAGVIANVAVLFNVVIQVAILAMFGASMTLPGICGLALTIGMAVDANVLINERIRDELRLGKSARTAVEVGYDRAFTAVLDGHVTSLLSGLILMQYGTGPIKGFAVTLIIGIITSLFTGVLCTRLMFDWAVRHRKVKKLSLG
jgi:preprotein translocase subunit SecD